MPFSRPILRKKLLKTKSTTSRRPLRGQALVEFALISIFLFMLTLGIIETGRLLLAYSMVSNSAQEGVRFGIIRPRDLFTSAEASRRILQGTPVPTYVVVPSGGDNIVDKSRDKIWGIPRADVKVSIWYDNGNGTPIQLPTNYNDLLNTTLPGNRLDVEATYHYTFIVPFLSVFAPNGFDIKMRSARTILRWGDEPAGRMTVTPVPLPIPTRVPIP